MNRKKILVGLLAAMSVNGVVWAASPLPQFEKEAIEDTYRRTGDMEPKIEAKNDGLSKEHLGNTGTEENPAFYVKKINLTGETVDDRYGELAGILASYENKDMDIAAMRRLQGDVTKFLHDSGFTVCQAVIPPQEVKNGELEVKIYIARYDTITRVPIPDEEKKRRPRVADRVLDRYVSQIKPGEQIRDIRLEKTLNRLNDLPGVQARANLFPGSKAGTTGLNIDIERRPVWNNYVFWDNGGTRATGRYRYGFYTEINNPGQQGDKIGISGMASNGDLLGGSIKYETPVGYRGTRMGVAFSLTDYDSLDELSGTSYFNTRGRSFGFSYYGYTPIYRDKSNRVHATWGYDYRRMRSKFTNDDYKKLLPNLRENKRHGHVGHVGINGSEYEKNRFTCYDLTYWFGNVTTDSDFSGNRGSDTDGVFHKATANFTHIIFDGKANYRVNMSAQIANRKLDSSERFYIGGMNSVRAYPGSEFSGDNAFYWCAEARHQIGNIKGLEFAAFIEGADAYRKRAEANGIAHRTLQGWGLGLRYRKDNDWHITFDWARPINRDKVTTENKQSKYRMWLQVYKMF